MNDERARMRASSHDSEYYNEGTTRCKSIKARDDRIESWLDLTLTPLSLVLPQTPRFCSRIE